MERHIRGNIMELKEKFINIVNKWQKIEKINLLKEYGDARGIARISDERLNEKCAELLILNLNANDIGKILNIK
jgi:hypothetical protein